MWREREKCRDEGAIAIGEEKGKEKEEVGREGEGEREKSLGEGGERGKKEKETGDEGKEEEIDGNAKGEEEGSGEEGKGFRKVIGGEAKGGEENCVEDEGFGVIGGSNHCGGELPTMIGGVIMEGKATRVGERSSGGGVAKKKPLEEGDLRGRQEKSEGGEGFGNLGRNEEVVIALESTREVTGEPSVAGNALEPEE